MTREQRVVLLSVCGVVIAAALFAASGRPVLFASLVAVACLSLFALWFNGGWLQRHIEVTALGHKGKIGGVLFFIFVGLIVAIAVLSGAGV